MGNSINIAGKNRYLTANLLLQSEKYLFGFSPSTPANIFSSSDISQLKDAMSNLEANIMTLKHGGMISSVNLKSLPSNLLTLWNSVDNRWNIYKSYMTNKVLTLPSSEARSAATTTNRTIEQSLAGREVESMASNLIQSGLMMT